jgi:filamentous hemagglutinin family protein
MQIPHTLGTQAGPNLFHSFQRFNIPTQNSATFTGPGGINNVISRVTGGEASTIDGTFRSTIPGANVWFTNPAGVTFGPNASLDVPASFHASTANEIRFPDGGRFSADLGATSTLSVAPPEAFGFLSSNPAPLKVERSQLAVGADATLSLAAGEIDIQGNTPIPDRPRLLVNVFIFDRPELVDVNGGTLRAPSGTINLASVAGPAEVKADGTVSGNHLGAIKLTDGALVNASGDGAGVVRIRGGEVTSTGSYVLASNLGSLAGAGGIDISADRISLQGDARSPSVVAANARNSGDAAPINMRARDITIQNTEIRTVSRAAGKAGHIRIDATNQMTLDDFGFIDAGSEGSDPAAGAGGEITVKAGNLMIRGQSQISSITISPAPAGNITVTAGTLLVDSVLAAGEQPITYWPAAIVPSTGIAASALSQSSLAGQENTLGRAGKITIRANEIRLANEAVIESITEGSGKAGDIQIDAPNQVILENGSLVVASSVSPDPTGAAGNITVNARDLVITGQSQITSLTTGPAPAGNITVTAGTVLVGRDTSIDTEAFGSGNAGAVSIRADKLTLGDLAEIDTSNGIGSPGNAGAVIIKVNTLILDRDATVRSTTFGSGSGGTVTIEADNFTLGPNARINTTASFETSGNAGAVTIEANNLTFESGAWIFSDTFGSGSGGAVTVKADNLTLGTDAAPLPRGRSAIYSSTFGSGSGGTVTIKANNLTLGHDARIDTSTYGSGNAGAINITADKLLLLNAKISNESKETGDAGTINIASGSEITLNKSIISTRANKAGGGQVSIRAGKLLFLKDSEITTAVAGGPETTAGDINIDPQFVVLKNGRISAQARQGRGGNIRIVADNIFRSPESVIDASSALGLSGTVNISSPEADVTSELAQLPGAVMNTTDQMQERCAVRGLVEGSSFTIAGPEALSPTLEGYLPGTYARVADEDTAVTNGSPMVASGGLAFPVWTVACGDAG